MTKTNNNKRQVSALKKNFEKVDKDKDGEISLEDWMDYIKPSTMLLNY